MGLPTTNSHNRAHILWGLIVLSSISFTTISCRASRISGVYVAHGLNSANMLQLTQTDDGQINGILSYIELAADGKLNSQQASVTGVIDAEQLILIAHSALTFLSGTNLAGTISGNTIQIQTVGSDGDVSSWSFIRSSSLEFKEYADQLKLKAVGIRLSANLLDSAKSLHQTVQTSEQWRSNAELHAERIPAAKGYYREIETKMQSLVRQERVANNSVAKSQISLQVIQGNLMGMQADLQLNQLWDQTIGNAGEILSKTFDSCPADCNVPRVVENGHANPQAVQAWENACQQMVAEREKFKPVFNRIEGLRADLKSFEATAQTNRQALVDKANRIH